MKNMRWLLMGTVTLVAALLLVGAVTIGPALAQGPMGGRMMGGWGFDGQSGYGPGMMMGYTQGYTGTTPYGYGLGWMHGGMMGGWGYNNQADGAYGCGGGMGTRGGGMWGSNSPFFTTEPLSVAQATEAVETFLGNLNDSNLALAEIMIFDNHAYAEVVEKDTGIGAMELLVDPVSLSVTPEMGPNMMWNQKYGMMTGYGSWGGATPNDVSAEMPVTPAAAVEAAQTYLDTLGNNFTVENHADSFYGYYTLHVNQNDQAVGMLSVNGYSAQVFLHTWHGQLLEMSELEH